MIPCSIHVFETECCQACLNYFFMDSYKDEQDPVQFYDMDFVYLYGLHSSFTLYL